MNTWGTTTWHAGSWSSKPWLRSWLGHLSQKNRRTEMDRDVERRLVRTGSTVGFISVIWNVDAVCLEHYMVEMLLITFRAKQKLRCISLYLVVFWINIYAPYLFFSSFCFLFSCSGIMSAFLHFDNVNVFCKNANCFMENRWLTWNWPHVQIFYCVTIVTLELDWRTIKEREEKKEKTHAFASQSLYYDTDTGPGSAYKLHQVA